jgi:hypothetical protein
MDHRLDQIVARADGNEKALELEARAREAVRRFEAWFPEQRALRRHCANSPATPARTTSTSTASPGSPT